MPSMTVILLSSEENEFSLLCFHILIYCLTTGKSGAENSALLVETCEQSPCSQAAVVIPTYEISFTSDVAFANAFLFNTANQPSAVPGNFEALSSKGMNIDPVEWVGSLQVNDAARPGSFVNIYPGEKFYVRTQVSSGWTISDVYTFTLQNSDQVCHLGGFM